VIALYHSPGSSCCVKVRLVLNEKGIGYSEHLLDLRRGDQLLPDYLKINPKAEVPAIVHEGKALTESTVIMEYLDEAFAGPPLKPADAKLRAAMRLWTKWPDEGGHIAYSSLAFAVAHRHLAHDTSPGWAENQLADKPDQARRARQAAAIALGLDDPALIVTMNKFDQLIRRMELALDSAPWLAGAAYSLADVALTPYINRLRQMTLLDIWQGDCPRVMDWYRRISERPSFAQTLAELDWLKSHDLMQSHGRGARAKLQSLIG
jgi:glutathione S-transferase